MDNLSPHLAANALLSAIGLVFTLGCPPAPEHAPVKKWWLVFWAAVAALYAGQLLWVRSNLTSRGFALFLTLLARTSTAALTFAYLSHYRRRPLGARTAGSIAVALAITSLIVDEMWQRVVSVDAMWGWSVFMALAWSWRLKHVPTSLLLVSYANLQIPLAGMFGDVESAFGTYPLLVLAKLSLIGAMYRLLGHKGELSI